MEDKKQVIGTLEYIVEQIKVLDSIPTIGEYEKAFEEVVNSLMDVKVEQLQDVEERKQVVELLVEHHWSAIQRRPRPHLLTVLGDFLLLDYIKDLTKSKFEENTFHTKHQLKRRLSKEYSTEADTMDYLNSKLNKRLDSLHKKTVKQVE